MYCCWGELRRKLFFLLILSCYSFSFSFFFTLGTRKCDVRSDWLINGPTLFFVFFQSKCKRQSSLRWQLLTFAWNVPERSEHRAERRVQRRSCWAWMHRGGWWGRKAGGGMGEGGGAEPSRRRLTLFFNGLVWLTAAITFFLFVCFFSKLLAICDEADGGVTLRRSSPDQREMVGVLPGKDTSEPCRRFEGHQPPRDAWWQTASQHDCESVTSPKKNPKQKGCYDVGGMWLQRNWVLLLRQ